MDRKIWVLEEGCAVSENGRLVEYIREEDRTGAGDWFLGKVERLMPGLDCAFVDIGRKRAGFLPLKENSKTFTENCPLRSGDRILVQIRREETGQKGAYLSRDLVMPGRTVLLMPLNRHIGVSARITDGEKRTTLRELGQEIAGDSFGLIMRSASKHESEEAIRSEVSVLLEQWESIRQSGSAEGAPGTVFHSPGPEEQLRDFYEPRGNTVIVREKELNADLSRQLREARNRTVSLPHGGNIVIDRCEAMTVMDVNSAANAGRQGRRETILETNLEACREIAVQTRLRNLSGMLIIDFINMDTPEDREQVQSTLTAAFEPDRIKTVIHGWTSLGLMEMTRKRTAPDLYETDMNRCPVCLGAGYTAKDGKK